MVASIVRHQHFQRASPLKLLGQFHLDFMCGLQAKGEESLYIWSRSHDKLATMPIYGKNLEKIFFSRITGLIALKLGM